MSPVRTLFLRELSGYFNTPVAYVFLVIFLMLAAALPFQLGALYEARQASLQAFFSFHPWLYLFLMPAISMRMWAEERNTGSIELLLTLPVTIGQSVLGKFLAAWVFAGIALALTFPVWITVNYLGDPDNGVIFAGYIGSWLLAGGFLAVGAFMSALSKSQVIAFILTVVVCFCLLMAGHRFVLDVAVGLLGRTLADAVASMSFLTHFDAIAKGVVDLRDLVFFGTLIGLFLYATALVIDTKKAE